METDMRTYFPVLPITAGTAARGLAGLITALTQQIKALARARRNRRQAIALASFDGRMLQDIGISQADVNDAFSSPFWEDPTSLLRERAIERRMSRVGARSLVVRLDTTETVFTAPRLDRPARQAI
jgi:uncharacterized protein YjiS (DUF1127 family)